MKMNLTGIKDIDFKILNKLDDKSLVQYCSANIRAYDDWAVQYASQNGYLEVVKYLVSLGAPPRR